MPRVPQTPTPPHVPQQPPTPPHVPQQPQPTHPQQPQAPQHPAGGAGDDTPGVGPIDPRDGWFKGKLKDGASTVIDSVSQRAGDWVGDQLFGPKDPEPGAGASPSTGLDGVGEGGAAGGEAGGGTGGGIGSIIGAAAAQAGMAAAGRNGHEMIGYGPSPVGIMERQSDAYAWAHAQVEAAMANLDPANHPDRNGLGGMLDEAVVWALEQSGLMDMLEKVTGDLAQLNAAAEEWQAQAHAVQSVAAELRGGAVPLSADWAGSASDAFGGHMGEVADALDQTAKGMHDTAQIINSAAQECAMAEGMVIQIISEAIEALIVSLAAEAVIAVVTMGIGLIADALITEAEIGVFVARVAKVSTMLAKKLEELLKALKELGSAVKAVRNIESARKAMTELKTVKTAFEGLRSLEEGEGLAAKAAKYADGKITEQVQQGFDHALGIEDDDNLQRGDGTWKGSLKAAGQSSLAVAKEGLKSDVNKEAIKQELLHDVGLAHDPAPYRVDESRIATAFG
ncbi:WXG100 family type VII secretion target [Kitasatospora sp. CB01950]|uniref:WXG100 family type VII secretion target n=1 Tax=Kitasatospora sp. CB01950 TaxID=1703930 RepID=UPI00093B2405|nr:WXG100 family type VII secretion target [Kitasatospora sp. CB01950]OKJ08300.1 hypothetical protein AMK19_20060 [Kitasatospora sp. CB01950]